MLRKSELVSREEPTSTGQWVSGCREHNITSSVSVDCVEDLQLLLDCLRYHSGTSCHGSPQRQALTTIATMCSNDSE